MVETTLQHMARGGIYDQLGGGFHRYSVDAQWLAPHFEKMLYDNALLAACYTEAAAATGNPLYRRIARETLDYVLRDMTLTDGGFAAAEDADSEGAEGKFYLWTPDEVAAVLGPQRAETFCQVYDVTAAGNFEGRNILHPVHPPAPESLYRPEKPPVCNGGRRRTARTRWKSRRRPNWPRTVANCWPPGPAACGRRTTTRSCSVGTA